MNIKVITRHAVSNYGSLLQAIATLIVLERLGYETEIIDYIRNDERGLNGILTWLRGKKGWNDNLAKKLIYILLRYPEEKAAEIQFKKMRTKYLKLTKRCCNKDDLKKLDADIFMTGSDQVWGLTLNDTYDDSYFLAFVERHKKLAYAASFGRTDFSNKIINEYKKLLSTYSGISVREDSAINMLKSWNIPCAGQVLDPTLMLTDEYWNKLANKKINKKYVLVYQIHNGKKLNYYAKRFSKHVGLPLIRVSPYLHQIVRGGKLCWLPDISSFLSYIKNCSYLITDSFHGTAFALNFNKQFIEVLEDETAGIRNQSILRLTHLEDRIVTNLNDYTICNNYIDYAPVNMILDKERERSLNILKSILK